MQAFHWQPNIRILVFVLLFLPLTIGLGFWQLDRAQQKQALLDTYQQRISAPPALLEAVDTGKDQRYRRVMAKGHFDNTRMLLLDHRFRDSRPGYEVLVPFRSDDGRWLLVNRGWVAGGLDRHVLPTVKAVTGAVTVVGHLYQSPGKPFVLGEEQWQAQWPQVLQNPDVAAIGQHLDVALIPYMLRLEDGAAGALDTRWEIINVQPQKHTAYAVQWFAMALALGVLAVFANSNLGALIKGKGA